MATTVQYECDLKNLTGTFAAQMSLTEKLMNRALVTPNPDINTHTANGAETVGRGLAGDCRAGERAGERRNEHKLNNEGFLQSNE